MKINKTKKHKPFTIKNIGKTYVFYRRAKNHEIPIMHDFMTCSGVAFPDYLVKDRGVLLKIAKTNTWSNFSDKPKKTKYITSNVRYEYTFLTKNGYEDSSDYYMHNGLSGWGVVK